MFHVCLCAHEWLGHGRIRCFSRWCCFFVFVLLLLSWCLGGISVFFADGQASWCLLSHAVGSRMIVAGGRVDAVVLLLRLLQPFFSCWLFWYCCSCLCLTFVFCLCDFVVFVLIQVKAASARYERDRKKRGINSKSKAEVSFCMTVRNKLFSCGTY